MLLFLLAVMPAHAQEPAPDEVTPTVSLLTFSPGDIYWERFGHNALLLRDGDGRGFVFNYGTFDFHQKNFFLNFALGRMLYRLDVDSLDRTLRQYAAEGRWVYEQKLDLTAEQRRAIASFLTWNLQPENVEYRYDYFADNCSTRVRDVLDRVTDGALQRQLELHPVAHSYRTDVTRLMSPELPLMIGMDLGLGPRVDHPLNLWQQSFVPMTLMEAVREVQIIDTGGTPHPLVESEGWLYRVELPEAPDSPPSLLTPLAACGLAFAALLALLHGARGFGPARVVFAALAVTFSLVTGLSGIVLAAAWALTDHWGMWANQNLLLLNPLLLLLVPAFAGSGWSRWQPGRFALGVSAVVLLGVALTPLLKLAPFIEPQQNLPWIALLLMPHLVLAGALRWPQGWRRQAPVP